MGRPINGKVLLQQLTALNPLWRAEYGIETTVQMKEDTVRLCSRLKGRKINIDITLSSLDLYDFKAYLLRNYGLELALIFNEQGYYCDQLDTVLKSIMKKADEAKPSDFKPIEAFI